MFIIAGLGNPGRDYANTRHNVGFDTIDLMAEQYHISVNEAKWKALVGAGYIEGHKVVLVKPQTYMNLSGESLRQITDFYKIDPTSELVVLSDDISLDVGSIRVRKKGSAGGHNGLKNIIQHLGTQDFMRIKIGVGEKPKGYDLADYVLGHFSKDERPVLVQAMKDAAEAVKVILTEDADRAMNRFNSKAKGNE